MVKFSDSALWCGHAMAGAPWRTWKSTIFANPSPSKLKSSFIGDTGACMTPFNLIGMSMALSLVSFPSGFYFTLARSVAVGTPALAPTSS